MKKIICIVCALISLCHPLYIHAQDAQSWYCKREKEHRRPSVEPNMSYITEENGFYLGKDEKVVYLTFDAGYENGNIERILNTLQKHQATGAFFILKNLIERNPDLVRRMRDEGHLVCNHTAKHKDMTKMSCKEDFARELTSLEELYQQTYGVEMPKYYRPPEGRLSEENLKWARELGYKTVMWSFAYADWDNEKQPSHEYAMRKILDNLHNGEIMLLHPTSSTNAEIMERLIITLKEQGFRFETVEGLCTSSQSE